MPQEKRVILSIDLKSFYASVECIDRNLDPFKVPLIVADESRGKGTIVLAASPYAKSQYHIPSRCRLYTIDKEIPGLVVAPPRMKRYLEKSAEINCIYLDYVSKDDLYIYSIDESFLDVTSYLKYSHDTPESYARKIITEVKNKTGLTVTAGIGENIFMAKACMDLKAKKCPDFLARWTSADIPNDLWPISNLSSIWGIGKRLEIKLHDLGFYTIGDIACSDPKYLKRKLGVIGEEIYQHSWGYDDALLSEKYTPKNHSISCGQVLLRDYQEKEIPILINDMTIELSDRLIKERKLASEIFLYLQHSDDTGCGLKVTFDSPTDSCFRISKDLRNMFDRVTKENKPYRKINLVACKLSDLNCYQPSLFENHEREKGFRNLEKTLIDIRQRYGTNKAIPCSALTEASNFLNRSRQIGGHRA